MLTTIIAAIIGILFFTLFATTAFAPLMSDDSRPQPAPTSQPDNVISVEAWKPTSGDDGLRSAA